MHIDHELMAFLDKVIFRAILLELFTVYFAKGGRILIHEFINLRFDWL